MRMLFCRLYRPLALSAVSLLALFGLSSVSAPAGASASPPPVAGSIGASVAAKSLATASITPPAPPPLPSGTKQACATPTRIDQEACMLFLRGAATKSGAIPDLAPVTGAYAPTDLRSAYNLTAASAADGTGETVAIVDAYADPNLPGDLNVYRTQYGLPLCNTTTSAGCLTVLNENGGTAPPTATDPTGGWEAEQAADVEMVSAICPNCKIVMVEANSGSITDLGTAENTAASQAKFVSNSWGGDFFDYPGDSIYDSHYFNHPGVAITFASGELGYGPGYPASSQLVTSVGGTYLTADPNDPRGWTETVWNIQPPFLPGGTQSGCSAGEAKPGWQTDPGCANRTQNDVSAVASGPEGVSIYDSFHHCAADPAPWCSGYGTSIAAPIIAAVYALAGTPTPRTYPSSYLYNGRPAGSLYPVTSGSNGSCETSRLYLCNANSPNSLSSGYNGPAGWGTPDGITAFTNNLTTNIVSVYNPGALDIESGIAYTHPGIVQLSAVDSAGQPLTYSQSGLSAGLSMSASGLISGGTTAVGTHTVKVTASDSSGASSTVSFVIAVAPSLESAYHPGTGPVKLNWDSKCLDDTGNSGNNGTKIQIWTCNGGAAQNWTYYPDIDPGDAGELTINGKCLDIVNHGTANGSKLQLWSCNGGANQQWFIAGFDGQMVNPVSGKCIDDPFNSTVNGKQLDIWSCNGEPWQAWTPPASPVLSGIGGKCMDDFGNSSTNGNKIQLYSCNGLATQRWTVGLDRTLRINGKCLDATGFGTQDGTKVQLWTCTGATNQKWLVSAFGMLENVNAEKCLADPSNSTANGTQLVLEDCYGDQGEVWAET